MKAKNRTREWLERINTIIIGEMEMKYNAKSNVGTVMNIIQIIIIIITNLLKLVRSNEDVNITVEGSINVKE